MVTTIELPMDSPPEQGFKIRTAQKPPLFLAAAAYSVLYQGGAHTLLKQEGERNSNCRAGFRRAALLHVHNSQAQRPEGLCQAQGCSTNTLLDVINHPEGHLPDAAELCLNLHPTPALQAATTLA